MVQLTAESSANHIQIMKSMKSPGPDQLHQGGRYAFCATIVSILTTNLKRVFSFDHHHYHRRTVYDLWVKQNSRFAK